MCCNKKEDQKLPHLQTCCGVNEKYFYFFFHYHYASPFKAFLKKSGSVLGRITSFLLATLYEYRMFFSHYRNVCCFTIKTDTPCVHLPISI